MFWYYFGALKFSISVLISKGRGPVIGIIELDIEYMDNAIELDGTARKFKQVCKWLFGKVLFATSTERHNGYSEKGLICQTLLA